MAKKDQKTHAYGDIRLVALVIGVVGTLLIALIYAGQGDNYVNVTFESGSQTFGEICNSNGELTFGERCSSGGGPAPADYQANLDLIRQNNASHSHLVTSHPVADIPASQINVNDWLEPATWPPTPTIPDLGAFRQFCTFSHLAYDDPIVFPNDPGASHLHAFYGNTETNAYSTTDTIDNRGHSLCNGGPLNRTGYWFPAVMDGQGNVHPANSLTIYYKAQIHNSQIPALENYPPGFRIIGGNAAANNPSENDIIWWCETFRVIYPDTPLYDTIPDCGDLNLYGRIFFPRCWLGGETWLPGTAHMVDMIWNTSINSFSCPPGTRTLTHLEMFLHFENTGGSTAGWFLSSDVRNDGSRKDGGLTLHGDWWNGWNQDIHDRWRQNCNQGSVDAGSQLCDGDQLLEMRVDDLSNIQSNFGFPGPISPQDYVHLCPGKTITSNVNDLANCRL